MSFFRTLSAESLQRVLPLLYCECFAFDSLAVVIIARYCYYTETIWPRKFNPKATIVLNFQAQLEP